MSEISDMRAGAADALSTIGVNAHPYVPGSLTPPAAVVGPPSITYDGSFKRDPHTFEFSIWLVVAHTSDRDAQAAVDAFMSGSGPKSVQAAIAADNTLGGAVADCRVTAAEPVDLTVQDGVVYLAAEFTLTALALRST